MTFIPRLRLARVAMAVSLLFPFASSIVTTPAASTSQTEGLQYVALGDSYASGYGIPPATGEPVAGCGQSVANYPHRVAKALGMRLTDVTCAGAQTGNIVSAPQRVGSGSTPAQSLALSAATRVITITIGGNDLGFVDTVRSCLAVSAHGPVLSTGRLSCRASFVKNGVDSLAQRISPVVSGRLERTFAAVRSRAPHAKVFVLGYSALMPDARHTPAQGCFSGALGGGITALNVANAYPYTDVDIAYLHGIEVKLDDATRRAAVAAGFTYISELAGSEAHTPCSNAPWMNGITATTRGFALRVSAGALHPNARGELYLANSVIPAIREAFPRPTPTPSPPRAQNAQHSQGASLWPLGLAVILVIIALAGSRVIYAVLRRPRKSGRG